MMSECVVTRYEEDPTPMVDLENGDQKVPSGDEYSPDRHEPNDIDDGEVPVKSPVKPMSDVYVQSLNAAKPMLQEKVLVENILPKLHKSAGGFLNDVERGEVESGGSNRKKMHIILEILKTKDNDALTTFCKVLETLKYVEAAEKLTMEIALRGHSKSLEDRPSEIELDKICKIVGGDYQRLLTHLGVPAATIKSFRLSNFGNAHSTCFEGLVFWREGNEPCRPATWSVLLDALEGAGLKKYADWRRSELLSLKTSCQTESLEKTHKVLKEKNAALSLSPLEAAVEKLDPILAEVLSEFRHRVTQLLPKSSIYSKVRSKCQTMIARKAGVSSFNKFDVPLKVSKFVENIIKKHTTFFDIELIHEVANLLEQPTLTEAVEKYEAILKPLMTTSIGELTDRCEVMPINQDSPEGTYRLVLKFPDDANVKNLYKAKDYLEKILHIPDAKLLAFDFGCILAYFEITCTAKTAEDLPKRFTKHSNELKAMGISGAFLIDHWAWDADSDDVWYADDESDDMEVNDQQGFLGNRKRSHLGSALGGCVEIVPSKKASQLKENCPTKKSTNDGVKRTEDMDQVQSDDEDVEAVSQKVESYPMSRVEAFIIQQYQSDFNAERKDREAAAGIFADREKEWMEKIRRAEEYRGHFDPTGLLQEEIAHQRNESTSRPLRFGRWRSCRIIPTQPRQSWTEEQLEYKTPSDRGLYEVASKVQLAWNQRILAEKLGVTLFLHQHNPLFNALKRWRDGGGGKNHPPTWRCLLDALSGTPRVGLYVVRDLEEKAKNLTEFSLDGDCRGISSSDYHNRTNLRSSKVLTLSSSRKSSIQPVHKQLPRKWGESQAISSLSYTIDCSHRETQRTIFTPPTSHISFWGQPQTSSVQADSTEYEEVESAQMDQTDGDCRETSSSDYHYQTNLRSSKLLKLSSGGKSSTQPILRLLARKRRNRLKAISSSAQSLNCHHQKSQRTICTSRTSHTPSLPFLAQPQTSSVQADPTDEVESTQMDQTDSGFSNDQ